MKTPLTTLDDVRRTCGMSKQLCGRKLVVALFMRLIAGGVLIVPVADVQAAVVFTTLYSFGSIQDTNGNALDGRAPNALVQGSDGDFYGTTQEGGTGAYEGVHGEFGTVFKITTHGALTTLHSFSALNDGYYPNGLVQGGDGNLYGTTWGGGSGVEVAWSKYPGAGTVFRISTNGELTTIYSFTGANDGVNPQGGLVQCTDGEFYGTTYGGGIYPPPNKVSDIFNFGYGTVFKISTNGVLTTLHSFGSVTNAYGGSVDGSNPQAGLVQSGDGNLYGTTWGGGENGHGTVFKISTNGVLTGLYFFTDSNDGASPCAGLVQGSDGSFYGTTAIGGNNGSANGGYGTVFKISTNGALTSLYSFTPNNENEGNVPAGGLVQGRDGNLYGTTWGGGTWGNGTVFRITTNGAFTTLYCLTGGNDGANPQAGLILLGNTLYGTTQAGGSNDNGTVFSIALPAPQLTIIPSGANMILTWPTNYLSFDYTGYTLQSATSLISPATWNPVSPSPVVIGGQNVVVSPISGTQQFYRLSQ
jgi:uncharacterized repeat protein (TIGR03803 family)